MPSTSDVTNFFSALAELPPGTKRFRFGDIEIEFEAIAPPAAAPLATKDAKGVRTCRLCAWWIDTSRMTEQEADQRAGEHVRTKHENPSAAPPRPMSDIASLGQPFPTFAEDPMAEEAPAAPTTPLTDRARAAFAAATAVELPKD